MDYLISTFPHPRMDGLPFTKYLRESPNKMGDESVGMTEIDQFEKVLKKCQITKAKKQDGKSESSKIPTSY